MKIVKGKKMDVFVFFSFFLVDRIGFGFAKIELVSGKEERGKKGVDVIVMYPFFSIPSPLLFFGEVRVSGILMDRYLDDMFCTTLVVPHRCTHAVRLCVNSIFIVVLLRSSILFYLRYLRSWNTL